MKLYYDKLDIMSCFCYFAFVHEILALIVNIVIENKSKLIQCVLKYLSAHGFFV